MEVNFDTTELQLSLREADDRMLKTMRRGFGETMSRVKDRTKAHINKHFRTRASQRVGNSLDSDIEIKGDEVYAIFGSRGPDAFGEVGAGVETSEDDSGDTWNLGVMYNEGTSAGWFSWNNPKTAVRGRPVGRSGTGHKGWMKVNSEGESYHYGLVGAFYIDHAKQVFENIAEKTVQRHIDREFNGVI